MPNVQVYISAYLLDESLRQAFRASAKSDLAEYSIGFPWDILQSVLSRSQEKLEALLNG